MLGIGGFLSGLFSSPSGSSAAGTNVASKSSGATNQVIRTVDGIRQKRLGGGDIIVSEVGLGTQRWVSEDFNAPNQQQCFDIMDRSILQSGVNLIDTAEQYPIPSSDSKPEGLVEETIGKWMAMDKSRRSKVVIATKITGGRAINKRSIAARLEASMKRLGTDYIDIYQLHWPARYSPQANWGQSLNYNYAAEPYYKENAGFEEICLAMGDLIKAGKLRGWGMCNDNCFGLTASCEIAKRLGVPPPISMQNDFSLIDRRSEENGVAEASSPIHENTGFMAYNVLAGGVLTGKYLSGPPTTYDNPSFSASTVTRNAPRGRHDEAGWSRTLYRYRSAPADDATRRYEKLAKENGLSLLEMSLLWCRSRRLVTTALLGVSNMKQLEENLGIYKSNKSLSPELLWEIDRIHMRNRLPIFSSDRVGKDWFGEGEIGEPIP